MKKTVNELMIPNKIENPELQLKFHYWNGIKKPERIYLASEIMKQLGYKGGITALRRHELIENVDMVKVLKINHPRFIQELIDLKSIGLQSSTVILIYESGINKLLLKSKKPIGILTRNWLASEVMPSIMHSGEYSMDTSVANPFSMLFPYTEPSVQKQNSKNVNGLIYSNNGDFRTYHNTVHKLVNNMTAAEIRTMFNSKGSAREILRKHIPENAMTESMIDEMFFKYNLTLEAIKNSKIAETAPPMFRSLYDAGIDPLSLNNK